MLGFCFRSLNTILASFCNLKLRFAVFQCLTHKAVKKITETAVTLLLRKILEKGCQKSKMNALIYKGAFGNKGFENKKLTLLSVVW